MLHPTRLLLSLALCAVFSASSAQAPLPPPFYRTPNGIGITSGGWSQPSPLELQTIHPTGLVEWTRGSYSQTYGGGKATGTLTSPGGAIFLFQDTYSNCSSGFSLTLSRTVTVQSVGTDEYAFATQFSLPSPPSLASAARQLFIPGILYENVSAVPPGSLAGDPTAPTILIREDRLPLPLVVAFFPGSPGGAGQLIHLRPNGTTLPNEGGSARIVDAALQFGSMGVLNQQPGLSLVFQYPGSEGDRTYVGRPVPHDGWANRSHPLQEGFSHSYSLQFQWRPTTTTYYDAVVAAWRDAFAAASPTPPTPAPTHSQLYRAGADLLATVGVPLYSGVPSMPFEARLPDGAVIDTSSQMGFVGRAIPAAALLLYDGLWVAPNATRVAAAQGILGLWAASAWTPCGAARTWYNVVAASSTIAWRPCDAYQGSIRISVDGAMGLIDAWRYATRGSSVGSGSGGGGGGGGSGERDGKPRLPTTTTAATTTSGPEAWLAAALSHADFLLRVQDPSSGAIGSAWDWSCQELNGDVRQTHFAIPLLVAAYNATGKGVYREGALRAGAFSATAATTTFTFTGGAVDNRGVADKEGGWLALQAFIALYEMTGTTTTTTNDTWLQLAARAATYIETFTYFWDVPIPPSSSPPSVFPAGRSTLGTSLIATGQSGADNFMAIAWYDFLRLGGWLGDEHFTAVGQVLLAGTAQATDWDGGLGYGERGLLNEAVTLSVPRGQGVADWLPWLTVNILQPLVQEREERGGGGMGGG